MIRIKRSAKSGITTLSITRGDSAYLSLGIYCGAVEDDVPYEMNEGDSIHIEVKDKPSDGELIFTGKIEPTPNGEMCWHIYPYDTKDLKITEYDEETGDPIINYYWDAELRTMNGDVFTFIPSSPMIIMDETTIKED